MPRILRENALCALLAAASCAAMAWLSLGSFAWNDYETEAQPSFDALAHGHVLSFLRLAPVYGGSLVERAPFALLPGLWGGGSLAVYRMVALPCLLAIATFAVWLCARMRAEGRPVLTRALALAMCVANPMALSALELGHPEELLGACLCVVAVVLASRGRAVWAGLLLGLAIANKEWALIAVGPVLLALPRQPPRLGRPASAIRPVMSCVASTGLVCAAIFTPLLLASSGFATSARAVADTPGNIFQPWQLWWFLGTHSASAHGAFGKPLPGYRIGPAWTGAISHPLIVVVGLGLAVAVWLHYRREHREVGERDAMLALALVLLLRCMLDTWNTSYYMLPFTIALLAWEVKGTRTVPILVLTSTVPPWFALQELSAHGLSPDAQSAVFLIWTVPLAVWLGVRLFARPGLLTHRRWSAHARGQEPPVKTLGPLARSS
jgi:Glycosyltransferase family 87